jgi:hypothetical protein
MNKRQFLKTLAQGTLAWVALPALQGCGWGAPRLVKGLPSNWLWMRPQTGLSDEEWAAIFARIRAAGIEAVLPQIFDGKQALFEANIPLLPVKEPLLERLVPLAHRAGLQIHAWMWSMPCNIPEVIEQHPDWYAVNGKGEPAHEKPAYVDYYKFLCPCHPEVQDFVQARVEALGKIEGLDGIHLDYIRVPDVFPNWESVRQQWHRWELDAFLPMLYNGFYQQDIDWIGAQVAEGRRLLANDKPVFSGLFIPDLSPEDLRQAIETSLRSGASGIALFDYELLQEGHWAILPEALASRS